MSSIKKLNLNGTDYTLIHGGGALENSGFEVVSDLPTTGNFEGREVMYNGEKYHYANGNWVSYNDKIANTTYKRGYLGNPSYGVLIQTNIAAPVQSFFLVRVFGNGYGQNRPFEIVLQSYYYSTQQEFINTNAISYGATITEIKIFILNGYVAFWMPSMGRFTSYWAICYKDMPDITNHVDSITNSAMPTEGVTKLVTVTPKQCAFTDGSNITFAEVNAIINKLGIGNATPNDNTKFVCEDASNNNNWTRRPLVYLWEYIKSKANLVYQPNGNYANGDGNGFLSKKPKITIDNGTTEGVNQFTCDGSVEWLLSLAKVATSGSYNDLTNKPTIPTVPTIGNGVLTIKQGATTAGTFSANATYNEVITLIAPAVNANINGATVEFSNANNILPCYIQFGTNPDVRYECRINNQDLQIYRNNVWATVIRSCNCISDNYVEISSLSEINGDYRNYDLTSTLTNELLLNKEYFPDSIPLDHINLNLRPVNFKTYKLDTLKGSFKPFIDATGAKFFIENDFNTMANSGSLLNIKITVHREPTPKIVVECYIEY